jgi:hypothetical protein
MDLGKKSEGFEPNHENEVKVPEDHCSILGQEISAQNSFTASDEDFDSDYESGSEESGADDEKYVQDFAEVHGKKMEDCGWTDFPHWEKSPIASVEDTKGDEGLRPPHPPA